MISASTSSPEYEYGFNFVEEQTEDQTRTRKNQPPNFSSLNLQSNQQKIHYPDKAHTKKSEKNQVTESLILAEIQLSEKILAGINDEIDLALKAGNRAEVKLLKESYTEERARYKDLLAQLKQSRQQSPLLESQRQKKLSVDDTDSMVSTDSSTASYDETSDTANTGSLELTSVLKHITTLEDDINQRAAEIAQRKKLGNSQNLEDLQAELIQAEGEKKILTELLQRNFPEKIKTEKRPALKRSHPVSRQSTVERQARMQALLMESEKQKSLFPEDKLQYFGKKSMAQIFDLCQKIEQGIQASNRTLQKIKSLEKAPNTEKANSNYSDNRQQATPDNQKELKRLNRRHLNEILQIAKFYAQLQQIEMHAGTAAQETEVEAKSFLDGLKSDKTKALELEFKEAFDSYKKAVNAGQFASARKAGWTALGGGLAFASSFLLPNSLPRLLPAPYSTYFALAGAPLLAGFCHTVFAPASAKQCMSAIWSAPALAGTTNYFRLLGSKWADELRGEADIKKYKDKNPENKNKLTIDERRTQEPPFAETFGKRYLAEEVPYFAYTLNYSIKGGVMAGFPRLYTAKTLAGKWGETLLHGEYGALSGASYLVGQQVIRSWDKDAKETILPTRAIYEKEARMLTSLKQDIEDKTKDEEFAADNKTKQRLAIKLRQTEKALAIANTKASFGGVWRYEVASMFTKDTWADTASEVIGRSASLLQTAGATYFTAGMRASNNPAMVFLGYALPAVALMAPPFGFTGRGGFSGLARAGLQVFIGGAKKPEVPSVVVDMRAVNVHEEGTDELGRDAKAIIDDDDIIVSVHSSDEESDEDYQGNELPRDKLNM